MIMESRVENLNEGIEAKLDKVKNQPKLIQKVTDGINYRNLKKKFSHRDPVIHIFDILENFEARIIELELKLYNSKEENDGK